MKYRYTREEIQKFKNRIDEMSHYEMAYLHRFAASSCVYFRNDIPEIQNYFAIRFNALGGMTPAISKKVLDYFKISLDAHDAMNDIIATRDLLIKMNNLIDLKYDT